MRRILEGRPTPVVIAAVLAAVISGTGTAVAARLITGKQIRDGTVQARDLSASVRSAIKDKRGARGPQGALGPEGRQGQAGAAGQPGVNGAKGDAGAPATRLWAVVESPDPGNATLVRGSGVLAVNEGSNGNGTLRVVFNRDVSNCTYVGSLGGTGGDEGAETFDEGSFAADFDSTDRRAVAVATRNLAGTRQDLSFHLIVVC